MWSFIMPGTTIQSEYRRLSNDTIGHIFDYLPVSLSRLLSLRHNEQFYKNIDNTLSARILFNMFSTKGIAEYIEKFGTENINTRLIDALMLQQKPGIGMFSCEPKKKAFEPKEDNNMLVQTLHIGPDATKISIYIVYRNYGTQDTQDTKQLQLNYVKYMFANRNLDDPIGGNLYCRLLPVDALDFLADHVTINLYSTIRWSVKNKKYDLFRRCLVETHLGRLKRIPPEIDTDHLWDDPIFRSMIPKKWEPRMIIENLDLVLPNKTSLTTKIMRVFK